MPGISPELEAALTQALLLARQGERARTEDFLAELRAVHDISNAPSATIRVMIAEGVMLTYSDDQDAAKDRLRRALALCGLSRDLDLTAVAHAWMAFVEYGLGLTPAFATHVFEAVRLGIRSSTGARSRAASMLGTAYARCAAFESSAGWFALARRLASQHNDGLMTSAIIFNMASTRLSESRVASICEGNPTSQDSGNMLFLKSSENYDTGAGFSVQTYLHLMLQGFAHSALGEHAQAVKCLSDFEGQPVPANWTADALVPAELAWCRLQVGDRSGALADALRALPGLSRMTDLGEDAVARRRISGVFAALGRVKESQSYKDSSDRALQRHRLAQTEFTKVLDAHAVDPGTLAPETS